VHVLVLVAGRAGLEAHFHQHEPAVSLQNATPDAGLGVLPFGRERHGLGYGHAVRAMVAGASIVRMNGITAGGSGSMRATPFVGGTTSCTRL
jgi:hypothetical protein